MTQPIRERVFLPIEQQFAMQVDAQVLDSIYQFRVDFHYYPHAIEDQIQDQVSDLIESQVVQPIWDHQAWDQEVGND